MIHLKVVIVAGVCMFVAASASAAAPQILAQATLDLPGVAGKGAYTAIVRSGRELAQVLAVQQPGAAVETARAALKSGAIDFDKQMLLVASPGTKKGETAAQVAVGEIVEANGELQVRWQVTWFQLNNPDEFPARRGVLCLVTRSDAPVKFLPPAQSGR